MHTHCLFEVQGDILTVIKKQNKGIKSHLGIKSSNYPSQVRCTDVLVTKNNS